MPSSLTLDVLPSDPLLSLMAAFRMDERPDKVDLGVGVYRDEHGQTPIMRAVKRAEQELLISERTKVYEGPAGNQEFCEAIERLVFGSKRQSFENRTTTMTTPGGCGALFLALQLMKRSPQNARCWVSEPTWPNHIGMAQSLGLEIKTYRYAAGMTPVVHFEQMLDDLDAARAGDIIIVQGPCHNPTGIDLSPEQWVILADRLETKGVIPLIDIAYHGLGAGLDTDMDGVLAALDRLALACVSYSCSKNFGLYRERTGCLITICPNRSSHAAISSHLNDIARSCYSMPPAHGAAIVQTILSMNEFRKEWEIELSEMRGRISALRSNLALALTEVTGDRRFGAIEAQKGMFSQVPLNADHAAKLTADHAIYLPASGRINIAGMNADQVSQVAVQLGQALMDKS
nr:aromatic amino acid transaminase [Hyphomonas sp. Mor2]